MAVSYDRALKESREGSETTEATTSPKQSCDFEIESSPRHCFMLRIHLKEIISSHKEHKGHKEEIASERPRQLWRADTLLSFVFFVANSLFFIPHAANPPTFRALSRLSRFPFCGELGFLCDPPPAA